MVQKKRNNISAKYMTYCLSFKKHTNNIASRNVIMTNKILGQNSGRGKYLSDKSRFLRQKPNSRSG